ncbi:hypothetical protein [Leptospira weilii]|nr:hypothetical protein [Leptospira weilii]ULH29095.1 hypothetical protein FH586_03940 [Leptospira weilii]
MNDKNKEYDTLHLMRYVTLLGTPFGDIFLTQIYSGKTFHIGESFEEGMH